MYELNNDKLVVEEIIKIYENHTSIKLIKDNVLSEGTGFTTAPATIIEINKIIKHLNPKKELLDLIRFSLRS